MVSKAIQKIVNDNTREYLASGQKLVWNEPRINIGNTQAHEMRKCELCYELKKIGKIFLSEPRLQSGGRPDILIMDTWPPIAYEIMQTETQESIEKKRIKYGDIVIEEVRL